MAITVASQAIADDRRRHMIEETTDIIVEDPDHQRRMTREEDTENHDLTRNRITIAEVDPAHQDMDDPAVLQTTIAVVVPEVFADTVAQDLHTMWLESHYAKEARMAVEITCLATDHPT